MERHAPVGLTRRRIAAYVVDQFIIGMLCAVPLLGLFLAAKEDLASFGIRMLAAIVVVFLVVLLKDTIQGMSMGKWIFGLRVLHRESGRRASIWRLALRNVFTFLWPLELAVLALGSSKLKLGDRVAGTCLVKVELKRRKLRIMMSMIVAFLLAIAVFFCVLITTIKHNSSYKTAIAYTSSSLEVLDKTGGIVGYGFLPRGGFEVHDGIGHANYVIDVQGKTRDVEVVVYLTCARDIPWHVERMEVK